ncbi:NADPH:quinone oxidoreductase family protein [Rhodococcus sp. MS16]|uniref:NADPH:quinone oxidoreductase family protein n=1 Tax=Rhodococcus sp. MS16 TaxID=2579941 RepID=UPI001562028D|nr:NADPH:quinone oxidoreductase family protein [Rhodococcus sp. MS16]NRI68702.1 NADPH:quinone oxidoreductase family protein [Rhodococcus sp. MS16]
MQAFQLRDYTGPDGLSRVDVELPLAAHGEIILRVHAIGVNFPDLLMIKGQYQHKPELPTIPGCEVAGTVINAPAGSGWKSGDRAAAFVWQGGYAEQVAVPLNSIVHVPDSVEFAAAAAMVVNYHTVLFALSHRGAVKPGETVLVMGAAGGIGTAAVQVAKGLGARVIAGVTDSGQAETATVAGATETILLRPGFSNEIRKMTNDRGVNAVLDPLGDWLSGEAIRGLATEGRLLVIGFAAGQIPEIKLNRLLLRNVSVTGVAFGAFLVGDHQLIGRQAEALDKMVASGTVAPHIGNRFRFDELPTALHALDRGEVKGKAVVIVVPDP